MDGLYHTTASAQSSRRTIRSPLISIHTLKIKCPTCGKPDNCGVTTDGRRAFCRRVRSDKPGRGGWWHNLEGALVVRSIMPARTSTPLAPIEHRDGIYCTLLRKHLTLSAAHRALLNARGLSDAEIEQRGYKSAPTSARGNEIAAALSIYGLEGVSGFYRTNDRWRMVKCRPGFFVPYRDERGRIQAMQVRLDEPLNGKTKYLWLSSANRAGGVSSGAPVHHAYPHLLTNSEEVTITEGGMKSDVIAYFTQAPVVGVAGVSTFGAHFATHLRAGAPALRTVVVAYDMDLLTKPEVLHALESLTVQLRRARFRVRVRTWPPQWKGLDDYLLAQLQRQEVRAA